MKSNRHACSYLDAKPGSKWESTKNERILSISILADKSEAKILSEIHLADVRVHDDFLGRA